MAIYKTDSILLNKCLAYNIFKKINFRKTEKPQIA